jgi:uncharacterized protein (TIGR03435 family)
MLIAAAAGLVLFLMRIKAASARHAVWTGVALAMLLLPAAIVWAPKAPLPVLPRVEVTPARSMILSESGHVTGAPVLSARRPAQAPASARGSELLWVYLFGIIVFLVRLGIGTVRVKALLRGTIGCASPVTVGWLRPRVILPAESSQWPQRRLGAVLAHEREHARRRDPLWQSIAILNRAVFWFHPLAWWLERKVAELSEEACDAAVLASGYDAQGYSECLLDLARSVRLAGARIGNLGAAMPGCGLDRRIKKMLGGGVPSPGISRARMAWTAVLCAASAAIFAAGTLVQAQSSSKDRSEFEVASVRPSNPDADGGFKSKDGKGKGGLPPTLTHGRFLYSDSLFGMIVRAYGIKGCRPALEADCALLSGGPNWIKKDKFDIQAKIPDGAPEYTFTQFFAGRAPQIQAMLQALLGTRFQLRVHRETKRMPIYALVVTKNGPKIKKAGAVERTQLPDGTYFEKRGVMFQPAVQPDGERVIRLNARNASMQEVAETFSSILERPVLDRTGLTGEFDFTMEYAADGDQALVALGGPELFTAFQEQAGLKLEATRAAVDVLVIDHAEKPSEN